MKFIAIYIKSSKTDQVGRGYTLPILCLCRLEFSHDRSFCPYCNLKKWKKIASTQGKVGDDKYVFPIPYNTYVGKLKSLVKLVTKGAKRIDFGTHSFRRGGAENLREAGVMDSLLCQRGRWSFGKASFVEYLAITIKDALAVKKKLCKKFNKAGI